MSMDESRAQRAPLPPRAAHIATRVPPVRVSVAGESSGTVDGLCDRVDGMIDATALDAWVEAKDLEPWSMKIDVERIPEVAA